MSKSHRVLLVACVVSLVRLVGPIAARAADVPADAPAGRLAEASLALERVSPLEIRLRWGESCLATDTDYAIYEGTLGNYDGPHVLLCSSAGATEHVFMPLPIDSFYLIVPRNANLEGSYGRDGNGGERPPAVDACLPQSLGACPETIPLADLNAGGQRWMDVADQTFADGYRDAYRYHQAEVTAQFFPGDATFHGILRARGLKPHFAYQIKLSGNPGTPSNEAIGLTGRWWQEEWNGSAWSNGHNLNNKGDGSSPNPNDDTYFERRDVTDPSSPTGLRYRFTGYLVFEYFVTDAGGDALLVFEADSSYHVLWKTSQRSRTAQDGPLLAATFDVELPDPASAYDVDYPPANVQVFGEWERLPVGGVTLPPGIYDAWIALTEESFHGSGLAGTWATVVSAPIVFEVSAASD